MKKYSSLFLFVFSFAFLSSCTKNDNYYIPELEPSLEASVYPQAAAPGLRPLGTEQATLAAGDIATFFVPFQVTADDVQTAVLVVRDANTGELLREVEMIPSSDLTVTNITVPEELQGQTFYFSTVLIDTDFQGHAVSLSTTLKGNRLQAEGSLPNAFIVP